MVGRVEDEWAGRVENCVALLGGFEIRGPGLVRLPAVALVLRHIHNVRKAPPIAVTRRGVPVKLLHRALTVEEWLVCKVHAFELPVNIAIAMALQNGFMAVHFHCCNVTLHIETYVVHAEENFPDIVRVTAFKGIVWGTPHANIADKWLINGLKQRAKDEHGKPVIPLSDGWLFRLAFSGLLLGKTQKSNLLGAKRTRKEKQLPILVRGLKRIR